MTTAIEAHLVANELLEELRPTCERLAIAGSLRRGAQEVKDVELVALPRRAPDLLGSASGPCRLAVKVRELFHGGKLRWRYETHPTSGTPFLEERRSWFLVSLPREVRVDLFAVRPPAQWGAILAIRTGPADYSRRLVTVCQRKNLRCREGRLLDWTGKTVPTPEERDFIEACGLPYAEPRARR